MDLPARDLDRDELRTLVCDLAEQGDWRALVHRDPVQRRYEQLLRTDHVDVWVLSWMHLHDTGYHDHDRSSGAVRVVAGEVVEERLTIGGTPRRAVFSEGDAFTFDETHVHRIHNETHELAVSIHAYSPPLEVLGAYVIEADGTLRREIQDGTEELKQLTAEPA